MLNPSIASEETIVSWGKRGGPEGTNMAFNYGNDGRYGAVGHWGGDTFDVGWIDNDPDFTVGAPRGLSVAPPGVHLRWREYAVVFRWRAVERGRYVQYLG